MTLTDLLSLSTATLTATTTEERAAQGLALARGFMDRLGESQPCHIEAPEIARHSVTKAPLVFIPTEWGNRMVDGDGADHMARLLLEAADTARQGDSDGEA